MTLHALMCFLVNLSNKSDALRMNNQNKLLHHKADQYEELIELYPNHPLSINSKIYLEKVFDKSDAEILNLIK